MSLLKKLIFTVMLLLPFGAFAADNEGSIFHSVSLSDSHKCSDGLDDNFLMQSFSIFTVPGQALAEMALNEMYGECDSPRFSSKQIENENTIPHIIMNWLNRSHAIYFIAFGAIVLPLYLIKISRDHHKAHKGDEQVLKGYNWSFFMQNIVMLTCGIGLTGMFTLMSASMLTGGYSAKILMDYVTPFFTEASIVDEGVTFKKTMKLVGAQVPVIVAQRVQAHLRDLEVATATYSVYAMDQVKLGQYKEKQKKVIGANTFDRFAECLATETEEPYYLGGTFISPEQEKTARCVKETGIADVTISRMNFQGDSDEIRQALIPMDIKARKLAAMIKAVTCTAFLNRNDNRNKYSDEVLVYKQCVDMNEHGVVTKKDGFIQLYDSSYTQEQIDAEFKDIVSGFDGAIEVYVSKLQAELKQKVKQEQPPKDIISTAISIARASNVYADDVSTIVMNELSQVINGDDQTAKVGTIVGEMTGFDSQSYNYIAGKREQIINFDLTFQRTIQPLITAESNISVAANSLFNFLTVNYYEDIGVNFKDCFAIGVECVPPKLNQSAAQYHAAQSVLDQMTAWYIGLKTVSIYMNEFADTNGRKNDFTKMNSQKAKARAIDQAASYVQIFISFQIFICIIQSSILYMALILSLMKWAFNFWITYINFIREMTENMFPKSDEFNKHNMLMSVVKKNIWLALAPCLSVAMFFINSAAYALILSASATYVHYVASSGVDNGTLASILNLIIHASLSIIVTTSLLPALVWTTNRIYKVIERMFDMNHAGEGAVEGLNALQKLEGKLKAHIPSKV